MLRAVGRREADVLVYGDPKRRLDLATWRDEMARPLAAGSWLAAHADLASRLIESGQALQALADLRFAEAGDVDQDEPDLRPLRDYALALARALDASWRTGETQSAALRAPPLPAWAPPTLLAREAEGFAFYALYPETMLEAARRLGGRPGDRVLGLRSIGSTLAPLVAAALGAPDFATVRPKGHPFGRVIDAPGIARDLRNAPRIAIVDEGPGLSGSSFAAAARLAQQAAPGAELHLFPSHPNGPGPEASAGTRALFARAPVHVVSFEEIAFGPCGLLRWVEDLTGPPQAPLRDLSGGSWRALHYPDSADWPAVDPMQERRKYLLETERGSFLLKFVGLGPIGARKAAMAQALAEARLGPQTLGLRHGFLVERWRGDARPAEASRDKAGALPYIARLLAFRRQRFAGPDLDGAGASELQAMTRRNVALALGEDAAAAATARLAPLADLAARMRRVATDNRMEPHEWLVTPGGALLKTDGVDHHAGHDLIGAQDIAWDIAGATLAWNLSSVEVEDLCAAVERMSGAAIERALIPPFRVACLAFDIGRTSLAEQSSQDAGDERKRLRCKLETLRGKLLRELAAQLDPPERELQRRPVVWPT